MSGKGIYVEFFPYFMYFVISELKTVEKFTYKL
jgi:hypothetical protein